MTKIEKDKVVFISNGTREEMREFSKILNEKMHIESEISDFLGKPTLYVAKKDYYETLSRGSMLAESLGKNHFAWCNRFDETVELGYIPVMYCTLPNTRKGEYYWEFDPKKCPYDIKMYASSLEKSLNKEVRIKYQPGDNTLGFYAKAPFAEHASLIEKCREFYCNAPLTPFCDNYCMNWDDTVLEETKFTSHRIDLGKIGKVLEKKMNGLINKIR